MQRTRPAVLAGGHQKHFDFLPGEELVSKTSRMREVYFYLWICQISGKPVFHTSSEDAFLEELNYSKKSAAGVVVAPGEALIANNVPARAAAWSQSRSCTSQMTPCIPNTGEGVDKKAEGVAVYPVNVREDASSIKKVDLHLHDSVETEDGCHQRHRFYIVRQEGCFRVKESEGKRLTKHLFLLNQSDEIFLRSLIIPGTSMCIDEFEKNSAEYRRQARAIAPWLPLCVGALERIHTPSASACDNETIPHQEACQTTTSTTQCATSCSSSGRSKGDVFMENLLHGMRRPAVLDTKLGTKYYGEVVSAAKREKEALYAQQRGTHEVGMAFGGYCCGSPFDENTLSVSGGSRAPKDFDHPKTLEAFSYWFQSFLMLQGNVSVAIHLGRAFADLISDLIGVWQPAQEKPLVNFFGTSVLLIYDAGAQDVLNAAPIENLVGGEEEGKGELMMKNAEGECDNVVEVKDQNVVDETKDIAANKERQMDTKDGNSTRLSGSGSGGDPTLRHRFTGKHSVDSYVDTEKSASGCTGDDKARKCEEASGHGSRCSHAEVTDLRRSESTLLNAKVRIVDFAHVVVLPQEVDGGFIFGLNNLVAALRLATRSLENTECGQLPVTQ